MRRTPKAQSAMEFLTTYGWAVLVMLVVVAVLFYVGVFSPGLGAPNSCVMQSGFSCVGYRVADGTRAPSAGGGLWLELSQATGKGITVWKIACTAKETVGPEDFYNFTIDSAVYIKSGRHANMSNLIYCTKENGAVPSEGENYRGTIYIDYEDEDTKLMHRITGDLAYKVESSDVTTP